MVVSMARSRKAPVGGSVPAEAFQKGAREVEDISIAEFMDGTYLPYALSVIQDRALVSTADGLKPSQRRILWTMFVDGVTPTKGYMKVARIAGNVLRYHPHGNASVEEALCRMVQPYSLRVPLIDGKGAFGEHPGDRPAQARYVEARLDRASMELLTDIKSDTVPMMKNYDDTLDEPVVLPVRWPVSVINGSSGIAVGYSANMPQHNPTEALEAARLLLNNPKATVDDVLKVMPGPDFYTGGTVMGTDGIREYFSTGVGSFRVRAVYNVEYGAHGKNKIVFTELPPGVSCTSIVEKVRSLSKTDPAFKGVSSINNFTGRENKHDVRLVVETKQGANMLALLAALFKKTQLQSDFSVNNTVLLDKRPTSMGVVDLLKEFLRLRKSCVLARTRHRISDAKHQLLLVDALLSVLVDIDKTVSIIRRSNTSETAAAKLKKEFRINDEQAQYILSMQLRRLTRQDSIALKNRRKDLEREIAEQQGIIDDPRKLRKVIDEELVAQEKIIGDRRYMKITDITMDDADKMAKDEARTVREQDRDVASYVSILNDGTVMSTRTPIDPLAGRPVGEKNVRGWRDTLKTSTKSKLVLIGSNGTAYDFPSNYIPFDVPVDVEKLGILPHDAHSVGIVPSKCTLLVWTTKGKVRQIEVDFKDGWKDKTLMNLDKDDSIGGVIDVTKQAKTDEVLVITAKGKAIRYPLSKIGSTKMGSAGIIGTTLDDGDTVAATLIVKGAHENIITLSKRTMKTTPLSEVPVRKARGGVPITMHQLVGADRIRDAVLDGAVLKKNTIVKAPAPTGRGNRIAPANASITLTR